MTEQVTIFSYISLIEFFILSLLFYLYYLRKKLPLDQNKKLYLGAFLIRVVFTPIYILYHQFILVNGDIISYYTDSVFLTKIGLENPLKYFQLLFSNSDSVAYSDINIFDHLAIMGKDEAIVTKIASLLNYITNCSILNTSLFFSIIAFLGCWKIYEVFIKLYPAYKKGFAYSILFVPSVVFWGNSISKDSICIGALGFLIYSFFYFFIFKENRIKNGIIFIICVWIFTIVKIYILLSLLLPFILILILQFNSSFKIRFFRMFFIPSFCFVLLGVVVFFIGKLSNWFTEIFIESVAKTILGNYTYLSKGAGANSSYDIGTFEPNLGSMISKFPVVVNLVLFRPYPWEIKNFSMALASIESLLFLLITLWVLLKVGMINFIKSIFLNRIVLFCICYCLIFAFFIGLSSGNYGSLMRIKIPLVPFYFSALVIIYYSKKKEKTIYGYS